MNYYLVHIPKTAGNFIIRHKISDPKFFPKLNQRGHYFGRDDMKRFDSKHGGHTSWDSNTWGNYNKVKDFKDCYKFAIIRNPYDLLVSYYEHDGNGKDNGWANCKTVHKITCFEDFVDKICNPDYEWHVESFKTSLFSQLYDENDKICVDETIRYEELVKGVETFCNKHNLNYTNNNSFNFKSKNKKSDYRSYYNSYMIDLIYKTYKEDFDKFNYDFDGYTDNKILLNIRNI
jgi:hypothetical protein